jgi:hypothetical protein
MSMTRNEIPVVRIIEGSLVVDLPRLTYPIDQGHKAGQDLHALGLSAMIVSHEVPEDIKSLVKQGARGE